MEFIVILIIIVTHACDTCFIQFTYCANSIQYFEETKQKKTTKIGNIERVRIRITKI